ncbi:tumor necrosis factor receptor superfamily member 14 isoform X2 [Pteronotus mesoamericanus]|uniref:tumor necrosis factor receptor superfamily member 14 isoform X2 n=1 Tax=Pteronotus mesoamericanus TaxID=1884717 RepID=UPI0023ED7E68|nr:tumor necrosis factor receptor superfamily member 14 isoform X2 [Pteronotus parnellii mesoamericanus]
MEPLQAWGPPPWSLAPMADALSLALVLVFLGCPRCALAMTLCKQDEYPVGGSCCPKCSPGYRVKQACEEHRVTLCVPCTAGTYTAHLNGLQECLQCRVCDRDMGQVTRKECSRTADTVCGCAHGHFCVSHDGDECAVCSPHSVCRPGQRVRGAGSEQQDTVCEDCPPGTFSPNGTLADCLPWTQCSGLFEKQAKPGTNSRDVTCSSWPLWLLMSIAVVCVLVMCVVLMWRYGGPAQTRWFPQVPPDVTTVAVEETDTSPKRDQTADK